MKTKWLFILLLCVGFGIQAQETKNQPKIEVIFFQKPNPCETCVAVHEAVQESLEKHFKKEYEKEEITLQVFSFDDETIQNLMEKYGAEGESLVVVHHKKNGTFEVKEIFSNLAEVALRKPAKAKKILQKTINAFYR